MKRTTIPGTALVLLALAACGPAELTVVAEVERMDPETGEQVVRPIENREVRLLPYDRDFIFDSLASESPEPEPQMPEHLVVAQDSILDAQRRWREAESEWLSLRERLQEISEEMELYSPAEARYRELFAEFDDSEVRYLDAESRKDEAFAEFERLQSEAFTELEEYRAQLEAWEDVAFTDYGQVVAERLRAAGREVIADTTDATGRALIRASPGEWWVNARFELPTEELYWNVPVVLERGEPQELRLTRENAERRPIF